MNSPFWEWLMASAGSKVKRRLAIVFLTSLLVAALFLLFFGDRLHVPIMGGVYDFGDVGARQNLRHDFIVENNSASVIVVRKVVASCGCLASKLTNSIIPPSSSALLSLTVKAPSQAAIARWWSCVLWSYVGESTTNQTLFTLKANVVKVADLVPSCFDFGLMHNDDGPVEKSIIIHPALNSHLWDSLGVSNKSGICNVRLKPLGDRKFALNVVMLPACAAGEFFDSITLRFYKKSSRLPFELPVEIHGIVLSPISASPSVLYFGSEESGLDHGKWIDIIVRSKNKFTLRSVSTSDPTFVKASFHYDSCVLRVFCWVCAKANGKPLIGKVNVTLRAGWRDSIVSVPYVIDY